MRLLRAHAARLGGVRAHRDGAAVQGTVERKVRPGKKAPGGGAWSGSAHEGEWGKSGKKMWRRKRGETRRDAQALTNARYAKDHAPEECGMGEKERRDGEERGTPDERPCTEQRRRNPSRTAEAAVRRQRTMRDAGQKTAEKAGRVESGHTILRPGCAEGAEDLCALGSAKRKGVERQHRRLGSRGEERGGRSGEVVGGRGKEKHNARDVHLIGASRRTNACFIAQQQQTRKERGQCDGRVQHLQRACALSMGRRASSSTSARLAPLIPAPHLMNDPAGQPAAAAAAYVTAQTPHKCRTQTWASAEKAHNGVRIQESRPNSRQTAKGHAEGHNAYHRPGDTRKQRGRDAPSSRASTLDCRLNSSLCSVERDSELRDGGDQVVMMVGEGSDRSGIRLRVVSARLARSRAAVTVRLFSPPRSNLFCSAPRPTRPDAFKSTPSRQSPYSLNSASPACNDGFLCLSTTFHWVFWANFWQFLLAFIHLETLERLSAY
ncbi:hypothetical protein K438DRAFT_1934023 [Mycena galopus ATCC 62051]|nr:hypothetical protein K438DRAFT_1934023 [Mycena galopus ATCC 62051]